MTNKKVCVVPCSGMGKALGSVAREVGFILAEDLRPDKTFLVCIPSLAAGSEEYGRMLKTNPVIVIDGCAERCATKIAVKNGAKINARFFLPESIRKYGLKPTNRDDIDIEGENLAKKVAEEASANVDKLAE